MLTFDQWKEKYFNPISNIVGIRERMMQFHGISVDDEIELIARREYEEYKLWDAA